MDGEVARATHRDTRTGYVLDGLADRLRETLMLIGAGVGAARAGHAGGVSWATWVACAVGGYLLFFYLSSTAPSHWREIRRESDLDEKHAFRVGRSLRLGAGDTFAMLLFVAALAGRPGWVIYAVAGAAPLALVLKLRSLLRTRPWDRLEGASPP
jgi:phosphatidylglycerophosphate synthase